MKLDFRSRKRLRFLSPSSQRGFAYVAVLILLAIMGVVSAATLQLGKATYRRGAEEALLDVGNQFSQALESYRRATPVGAPDAPGDLQELLKDPRFPGVVRHQRKSFADPLTGRAEWGVLRDEESKRIIGVYSLSSDKPIKIGNFDRWHKEFEGKSSYREWVFTAVQAETSAGGGGLESGVRKLTSPLELLDSRQPALESAPPSYAPGLTDPRDLQ